MSRFNLIDEKWIPVRFLNGTRDELGIMDTLLRSKDIAVIEDQSPLVVAALHRFLLAVLYRALEGPTDIDQAKELFKTGLPEEKIKAYLEKWRNRFWLFDEKYPFYQVAAYEPQEKKGEKEWRFWPTIATEHNANNAKVLFDHIEINAAGAIPSGKAVQWLIACQTFVLGGGNSDFVYTKNAPSATAVMAVPLGIDLQDTLIFSLVPENKEILANDLPIWEQEPVPLASLKRGVARSVKGFIDLYTWLARSVKFDYENNRDMVSKLAFASGVGYSSKDYPDPMLAYKPNDEEGKRPIWFRDRGFWRDFDSLLPDNLHLSPLVIEHAAALTKGNITRSPQSVLVLGQSNDHAKIEFWRMEQYSLPPTFNGNRFVRTEIHQLLEDAEHTQKNLWIACSRFARLLLSRGKGDPDPKDVSEFIKQIPAIPRYWSILESHFHEILGDYVSDRDHGEIRCRWLTHMRDTLKTAWEQYAASVSAGDAWAIRALVKAEGAVWDKVKELDNEIGKYRKQEVNQ